MRTKNLSQFSNESENTLSGFKPKYFDIPYSIPKDRSEGGNKI